MKGLLVAIVVGSLGVALLVYSGLRTYRTVASRSWPQVEGHVMSSEVSSVRSRRSSNHTAHVSYAYEVAGHHFASDVVAFSAEGAGSRDDAQEVVQHYPRGATVQVHYSPSHPEVACLEPGVFQFKDVVPLGLGVVLSVSGALAVLGAAKGKPTRTRTA